MNNKSLIIRVIDVFREFKTFVGPRIIIEANISSHNVRAFIA